MEIKVSNTKFITKWLEKKVKEAKRDVEVEIAKIPIQAQTNYDRFQIEVPADDPRVDVLSYFKQDKDLSTMTINCVGNQVLFIEFGAGQYYYTEKETILFKNDLSIPNRPVGIAPIGKYSSLVHRDRPTGMDLNTWNWTMNYMPISRGRDEFWFYKSRTGRTSENAHLVKYNKSGNPIMITRGNRPSRSLYRAVGMAMRRIRTKINGRGGKSRQIG